MYFKLDDEDFHIKIPDCSGVYKIYSVNEKEEPKELSRLLGTDKEGILYIGQSENLKDRLRMLYRVLHPHLGYKAKAHTFGNKYNMIKSFKKNFPLKTLVCSFEKNDESKNYEETLIRKYSEIFGEVPPGNSNIPNKKKS